MGFSEIASKTALKNEAKQEKIVKEATKKPTETKKPEPKKAKKNETRGRKKVYADGQRTQISLKLDKEINKAIDDYVECYNKSKATNKVTKADLIINAVCEYMEKYPLEPKNKIKGQKDLNK